MIENVIFISRCVISECFKKKIWLLSTMTTKYVSLEKESVVTILLYSIFFLFLFFLKGRHSGKSVYLTARYRISFTGPLNIGSWRLLSGFKADQLTAAPKRADHL